MYQIFQDRRWHIGLEAGHVKISKSVDRLTHRVDRNTRAQGSTSPWCSRPTNRYVCVSRSFCYPYVHSAPRRLLHTPWSRAMSQSSVDYEDGFSDLSPAPEEPAARRVVAPAPSPSPSPHPRRCGAADTRSVLPETLDRFVTFM